MPDPNKKLLVKLKLDNQEFRQTLNQIRSDLQKLNQEAKKNADSTTASAKEQLNTIKLEIAEQQKLVAQSKAMEAFDKAHTAWQKDQIEKTRQAVQLKILETAEAKKQSTINQAAVGLERSRLALQQQQLRMQQQITREQERQTKAAAGKGGTGLLGTLVGALGGGAVGSIAAGVGVGSLLSEAAVKLIDTAKEKIKALTEALLEASGPAAQLREQFEKLAGRAGVDPEGYLNKLRIATRGLADDTVLYRIANNYMQQGLKVSTDQIARLITATVDLARAQGRTAPEAMQALERASKTGRTQALAMITGLTRQELALRGISQAMDPLTRNTIQFTHTLAALEAREKAIGTPATTLPELFEQWRVAQKNLSDDMAITITKSSSYRDLLSQISELIRKILPVVSEFAVAIGKKLGDAFVVAIALFHDFVSIGKLVIALGESVYKLTQSFMSLLGVMKGGEEEAVTWRKWVGSMALLFESLAVQLDAIAIRARMVSEIVDKLAARDFSGAKKAYNDAQKALMESGIEHAQAAGKIMLTMTAKDEAAAPAGKEKPLEDDMGLRNKLAKEREQLAILTAKVELEAEKQRLTAAELLNKTYYDSGIISLAAYTAKAKAIKAESLQDTLNEIEQERRARLNELATTSKVTIDGQTYEVKNAKETATMRAIIDQQANLKIKEARMKSMTETVGLDRALLANQESAYQTYVNDIKQMSMKGVEERIKILEKEFQQGRLSADDYLSQRRMLIQEEYEATVSGLNQQLEAAKDNAAERAKISGQLLMAEVDRLTKVNDLEQSSEDIRLKATQTRFDQAKKYLDTQAKIATLTFGPGARANQIEVTEALRDLTKQYVGQLQEALKTQTVGTEEWIKTTEQIAQATEEQDQYNQKLRQMEDAAGPLSTMFGKLGEIIGQFRGAGAQGVAQTLKNLETSFASLSKFNEGIARFQQPGGPGGLGSALGQSFTALFHRGGTGIAARKTAQQIFDEGLVKSTNKVDTFGTQLAILTQQMIKLSEAARAETEKLRGGIERELSGEGIGPKPRWSFQHGGVVPATGTALVHQNELIIPAGMNNALTKLVEAIQHAAEKITSIVTGEPTPGAPAPGDGRGGDGGGLLGGTIGGLAKDTHDTGKKFAAKLGDFTDAIGVAAEGVLGFVSAITSAKSGGQGALQGGMAGMQLGASLGGPIGAAIGLVGGGIMGGISGAKEKQLMQDLHKIQGQMQSIVESMNEGAITLSQAIEDLRKERQAAIKILAQDPKGGKGGGKGGKKGFSPTQAQAAIQQIDQEIGQLVNQQKQLLDQLNQQIAIMATPLPFQQYVQSLDQIIQKYQQFSSAAAGNAQEVGNAQLYLNESLQQYVQTLSQQLNQAQQQAIQDSLTLLNLEYQRQQIINQEAQQEYDILTQGVLTRQRTTAMTKGQEIGQLRYQRNMQLQQIDEQIALQQYKVSTEQKIFDMQTTRIGLEMQLLSLQESQAGVQNQQTAALLQVVQQLQAAMASGTLETQISALGAGGAAPTGTGLLTTLLGALGLGGYVPPSVLTGVGGATNYLAQIPEPYQAITNYINNLDPNFLMNLWSAMQTPPGSSQRQGALTEAAQYGSDAVTAGYDWRSFVNWINRGDAITGTTATVTNAPVATGAQPLPGGTPFPMPTATGYAPTALPTPTPTTGQTPFQAVSGSMDTLTTATQNLSTVMQQLADNCTALVQGFQTGYTGSPIRTPVASPAVPAYQTGGPVASTGLAYLHGGEYVLTPAQTKLLSSMGVESHLYNLQMRKSAIEMNVISARQDLLSAEMDHLSALNDTLDKVKGTAMGPAGSLESMFQQVYETRGRYGSATFRRTNL